MFGYKVAPVLLSTDISGTLKVLPSNLLNASVLEGLVTSLLEVQMRVVGVSHCLQRPDPLDRSQALGSPVPGSLSCTPYSLCCQSGETKSTSDVWQKVYLYTTPFVPPSLSRSRQ